MCKKLIHLFSFVLLLGLVSSTSAQNLIQNPGFEDNGGSFDNWLQLNGETGVWSWNYGSASINTSDSYEGIASADFYSVAGWGGGAGVYHMVLMDGGVNVSISAYVKGIAAAYRGLDLVFFNYIPQTTNPPHNGRVDLFLTGEVVTDGYTGYVAGSVGAPDGSGWQYCYLEAVTPPGTMCMKFEVNNNNNGGHVLFDNVVGTSLQASQPNPANGAVGVEQTPTLSWLPGMYAASHDVYFGTDFNDVNDATDPNVLPGRGNQPLADVNYVPGLLEINSTYYWRIDEVNDPNTWKGAVWSFTVTTEKAFNPNPPDGMVWVDPNVDLSWEAGVYAASHNVYFGTADPPPPLQMGWPTTTYDVGLLDDNTTYYWRIDEVNDPCVWTGDVWNFTTGIACNLLADSGFELNEGDWGIWTWGGASAAIESDPAVQYSGNYLRASRPGADSGSGAAQNFSASGGDILLVQGWLRTSAGATGNCAVMTVSWGDINYDPSQNNWLRRDDSWDIGEPALTGEILDWTHVQMETPPAPAGTVTVRIECFNNIDGIGDAYFDEVLACRVIYTNAYNPSPANGAVDVKNTPTLSWSPGAEVASHEVYFDPNKAKVEARSGCDVNGVSTVDPCLAITDYTGPLDLVQTYYWAVDEINDPCLWLGDVWSFTVGNYLIVDDFESYNPSLEDTWEKGGKATVSLSTDPVHEGDQAMAIDYNNAASPYYSEAFADTNGPDSLDFGTDWTIDGVEGLSLWFRGYPDVRGSFDGNDPYTLVGDGWDIEDTADGFHYAYKKLTGTNATWRVQARVDSIDNTDPWAKAGVMVRKTLEPGSIHATVVITPENGVLFQWRNIPDGNTDSNGITDPNIAAPYWVRVTRRLPSSGTPKITAEYSSDGSTWVQIGEPLDLQLVGSSTSPVYLGLCVTSHTSFELCTAELSNVYMARNVTYLNPDGDDVGDPNADKDIGIPYNAPEPMYVVLEDSDSNGIVYHPDPNAVQMDTWTEWRIDLKDFDDQDVNLTDVQRIYIGFGDRGDPCEDGSGTVFIDDVRLYLRRCILSERSADFAKADYAPVGDPSGDCVVDYREIEMMGHNWLFSDYNLATQAPNDASTSLMAWYKLDGDTTDSSGNGRHGTLLGNPVWIDGRIGPNSLSFDSAGDAITCGTYNPSADTNELTVALWSYWNGLNGNYQGLVAKRDSWDSNDMMWQFNPQTLYGGLVGQLEISQPDSTANWGVIIPEGEWAHLAVTTDGNDATLYINGGYIGTLPFTFGTDTDANIVIGASEPNGSESFNGDIDDVRIYNYALSQAEVAYLAVEGASTLVLPMPPESEVFDLCDDNKINFKDFARVAECWLKEELWPRP